MKINIKKFLFSVSLLGLVLSPVAAGAETSSNTPGSERGLKSPENASCVRIGAAVGEMTKIFTGLEKNRTDRRSNILDELKKRKDNRTENVQKFRDEAKKKFAENINDITKEALTAEQKAAIAEFKATVEQAMTTRKIAVDAAMQTYRTALNQLVTDRQNEIKTVTSTFRSSVSAAIAKAKADCAAGIDPETVKQTLKASLKAAKDKLQADLKALELNGSKLRDLAKTRDLAIKAANKIFKDTVQAAKIKLKDVLISS